MADNDDAFGPWNPGLESTIPKRLMPRVTLFDPRHSYTSWDHAQELSDLVGIAPHELAVIRPERLALHSVLIRVTSQLYVPDGPNYADLGISLRAMAMAIHDGHVAPEMDAVRAAYEDVRQNARTVIEALLDAHIYVAAPAIEEPTGVFARLFSRSKPTTPPPDPTAHVMDAVREWRDMRNEDIDSACRRALSRVIGGVLNRRGALLIDRSTIADVAEGLVLNRIGSAAVGKVVQELFSVGAEVLGYRVLPAQSEPVVLNAKGASASGKSSIRADQRLIAERSGLDWQDFAIISPDYWRKALLDYDGLGADYKYAGMLCGQELEVIDRKLDILMAVKGANGSVPHMLIDRFRFDSFQPDRTRAEDSTLLTRFGAKIYLFFLITPPADTVDRAWTRGLETGRYKAVDDLLYHNVEAYTGMPDLFFRWAKERGKWVHYEFLDNSVARGERPRTIAYGSNGDLVVVDIQRFCDVDRFRHVNVDASEPADVLEPPGEGPNTFLRRAITELTRVDVMTPDKEKIFARAVNGQLVIDKALCPPNFDPSLFGSYEDTSAPLGTPVMGGADVVGA